MSNKLSIKEKRKLAKVQYLTLYHDLMWFFSNKNKFLEKGFSKTDAEVLSFIIDTQNSNMSKNDEKYYINGYFKCTSSYINLKLEYTETTIFKSVKRLNDFGVISCKVVEGERFIRINENVLDIILKRYNQYEKEITREKFSSIDRSKRDLVREKEIYDEFTSLVVKDIKSINNKDSNR